MTRQELCKFIKLQGADIYGFCCHLTQNKDKADDLYQETFLKAAERLEHIDISRNPKSFFISLAVGIWKNERRKYAYRQKIAPIAEQKEGVSAEMTASREAGPEEQVISEEACRFVRMETALLHEKYRLPVYMYYVAEMPLEQIAAALHIPKGTVKSRLHKARKLIRKGLEERGYEG